LFRAKALNNQLLAAELKMKKLLKKIFIVIAILFAGLWSLRLYNIHRLPMEKETRFMMDTYVTIYALGPKKVASSAISSALDRMQEIAVKFDSLNPKSPVYAFNHRGVPISDPEILKLIQAALQVSGETKGAFDITVAPLLELWGFYDKSFHVPQDGQIKDVLKKVGYQHLFFLDGKLEKDEEGVEIDLGGIAKGYALSEAVKVLKAKGVTQAVVDAGGDVYALGRKGKDRLWRVGIRDPRGEGIVGYVEVEDLAVLGSGDYERFFIQNGKRYHHIFNPKTGYPTEGVASVTLVYHDPVFAQILAKIPFLLGPKKGLEFLGKIPGMEVIVITTSGEKLYSFGLKHILNVISEAQ